MKTLFKKFETMMTAAAFAEEGESETARQILTEGRQRISERPTDHKRPEDRPVLRAE